MAKSLFSASWYRVAALKPQIHRHAIFHRHDYRGQAWHVIEDRAGERFHRFAPATYFLIGLMDGERSVDQIWRAALEKLGDHAPSQDDVIRLLAQLHAADLIKTNMTAEADDLFRRYRAIGRQNWLKRLGSPFSMRLPLLDPDRLLSWLAPLARPLFTFWGFLAWLLLIAIGFTGAALHWSELTDDFASRLLAPWNLVAIALAYPILKLCHELGHALAVKVWGGRVHDIGVMFIIFMPVPYVDASASSSFPSKWRRIVVDSAGIMVELLLASIAVLLWIGTEPGAWRSVLYNIAFIGTVSTLLFNGNPLLKFDGYYIFADFLEIPNLAQRAQAYLGYLFDRYLLGIKNRESPVSAPGERLWFLIYAPLAGLYRVFLTFSIAFFLASQYMIVGVLLAGWALALMVVAPLWRAIGRLFIEPESGSSRFRSALVFGGLAAILAAALFVLPVPRSTVALGVAVVPEKSSIRAGAEGFVTEIIAEPNSAVRAGEPLVRVSDPTVDAEVKVVNARLAALKAKLAALAFTDAVEAAVVREDIKAAEKDLQSETLRKAEQTILAPTDGLFRLGNASDKEGRFVERGETIGFVQDPGKLIVSVVVDQVGFGAIQGRTNHVALWPAGDDTAPMDARLLLVHPGGITALPSPALSTEGGGDFPVDPRRPGELRTLANVFQIDVEPVEAVATDDILIGRHYAVRFQHEPEPIGFQLIAAGRRLLLSHFGI